jgi:hypothetical protein
MEIIFRLLIWEMKKKPRKNLGLGFTILVPLEFDLGLTVPQNG